MQYTGEVKVTNGSNVILFVWEVVVSDVVGTFSEGEVLSFTSGATGILLGVTGFTYKFAVDSTVQPVANDDITGGTSSATATIDTYETIPDLLGFGVDAGSFFLRQGDQVAYILADVPTKSKALLSAEYAGVSGDSADGFIHTTRTPQFQLPMFDRRDRELQVWLNELVLKVENIFADHEERITLLE